MCCDISLDLESFGLPYVLVGLFWKILWIVGNVMESCLNGFGLIIYLDLNVIGISSHYAKEGC